MITMIMRMLVKNMHVVVVDIILKMIMKKADATVVILRKNAAVLVLAVQDVQENQKLSMKVRMLVRQ